MTLAASPVAGLGPVLASGLARPLPSGFWWCVAGLVACGGAGLLAFSILLRRVRLARVRRLAASEDGTTIVEFPFAMLTLVLMTTLTWQLGFMASAYLVVDYAAYAAVRAAIVQIPPKRSNDEPANKIKDISFKGSDKGSDIEDAAIFVCYPISGTYTNAAAGSAQIPILDEVKKVPGWDTVAKALGPLTFALRYVYAMENTSARLVVDGQDSGAKEFSAGDLLTVQVVHQFSLRVPIAERLFGKLSFPAGYTTALEAKASMLFEGANEQVPADAPSGAQP